MNIIGKFYLAGKEVDQEEGDVKPLPPFDASFGLMASTGIDRDFERSDWKSLEEKILRLHPNGVSRALNGLRSWKPYKEKLRQDINEPSSDIQKILRGAQYIEDGWKIRGTGLGKDVESGQAMGFFMELKKGEKLLNPDNFENTTLKLEAIKHYIVLCKGISHSTRGRELFKESQNIDQDHFGCHSSYMGLISPRWGGSAEEIEALAENHPTPLMRDVLRVMYMAEMADHFQHFEDSGIQGFREKYGAYTSSLLSEIRFPTDRSITSISLKNNLCFLYTIIKMKKQRNKAIKALSTDFNPNTWRSWGIETYKDLKWYKRGNIFEDLGC